MPVIPPSKHPRVRRAHAWLHRALLGRMPLRLEPGVTVLVAYHRTPDLLATCLEHVLRHGSELLRRVIVVDNASGDDAARALASSKVDVYELPVNVGHGWALDWAAWHARTEYIVSLDSDAWPLRDHWLEELVAALESGAACAGVHHHRNYIHPSCLAIRTATFRRRGLSFVERLPPAVELNSLLGIEYWDVGEAISMKLVAAGERLHRLPIDRTHDPMRKMVGSTYGSGLVYHLWYGTRLDTEEERAGFDGIPRELIEAERKARTGGRAPAPPAQ